MGSIPQSPAVWQARMNGKLGGDNERRWTKVVIVGELC